MTTPERNTIAADLRRDVVNAIRHTSENTGRGAQTRMGPSEIGHPCDRRIAYQLEGNRPISNPGDPLASYLGTGGHAQLEDTFQAWEGQDPDAHEQLIAPYRDQRRYLTETPVHPAPGLSGTCDLYDLYEGTVIDFKWVGAWSMNRYRKYGPSTTYRTQAHTYGLGWANAGHDPQHVAIVFLPRETNTRYNVRCHLDYVWVWSEPYDRAIADQAIARVERIRADIADLDMDATPDLWEVFPTSPGGCKLCPFHNPLAADLGHGCPGV